MAAQGRHLSYVLMFSVLALLSFRHGTMGGATGQTPAVPKPNFPSRSAGAYICQLMCYFLSVFICMHPMGCSNIGSSGQKNVFLPGDDGRIKQQSCAVFCLGQENKMKLRKRKSLFMSHRGSCLRLSHGDLL